MTHVLTADTSIRTAFVEAATDQTYSPSEEVQNLDHFVKTPITVFLRNGDQVKVNMYQEHVGRTPRAPNPGTIFRVWFRHDDLPIGLHGIDLNQLNLGSQGNYRDSNELFVLRQIAQQFQGYIGAMAGWSGTEITGGLLMQDGNQLVNQFFGQNQVTPMPGVMLVRFGTDWVSFEVMILEVLKEDEEPHQDQPRDSDLEFGNMVGELGQINRSLQRLQVNFQALVDGQAQFSQDDLTNAFDGVAANLKTVLDEHVKSIAQRTQDQQDALRTLVERIEESISNLSEQLDQSQQPAQTSTTELTQVAEALQRVANLLEQTQRLPDLVEKNQALWKSTMIRLINWMKSRRPEGCADIATDIQAFFPDFNKLLGEEGRKYSGYSEWCDWGKALLYQIDIGIEFLSSQDHQDTTQINYLIVLRGLTLRFIKNNQTEN